MKKISRSIIVSFLFAALIVGCSSQVQTDLTTVKVIKVTDGDTIKVNVNGMEENVRFLLVDTPEMHDKDFDGPQPFAEEAKAFVADLLDGENIELEIGTSERDKYGRLLAYIYINDENVQEMLLERGLARVAYIYPPNTKYVDDYRRIQDEAQKKAVGIWSIENYATEQGFQSDHTKQISKESTPTPKLNNNSCKIKGNVNSKGEKIYHMPDGQYYEQTQPEQLFCSEQDAKEAGFRKSSR